MKVKVSILSFAFLLNIYCYAQDSPNDNLVKWDESEKIEWDHFFVKEGPGRFAAECHTFFKANFYLENDSVFCQIVTYLNKDSSWRKPGLKKDDPYNINHEQVHFDITEIFARKIRKHLIEYPVNEQDVKKVYFANAKECRRFQESYDKETRHSLDRKKQVEWNIKIQHLLAGLNDFREQAIFIENPWCKLCWKDMPRAEHTRK